jgi:hypothetical protein
MYVEPTDAGMRVEIASVALLPRNDEEWAVEIGWLARPFGCAQDRLCAGTSWTDWGADNEVAGLRALT